KYAEIKVLNFEEMAKGTEFEPYIRNNEISLYGIIRSLIKPKREGYRKLTFKSDKIRCFLLLIYGGIWFDLDIFFLRSFSPLFANYGNKIFAYRWQYEDYPNNAIFCNVQKSPSFLNFVKFMDKRGKGWGF